MRLSFVNPEFIREAIMVIQFRLRVGMLLLTGILFHQSYVVTAQTRKILLPVGKQFFYQVNDLQVKDQKDTSRITTWLNFQVLSKRDSIYNLTATISRRRTIDETGPDDTRDGYYAHLSIPEAKLLDTPVNIHVTEQGQLLPVEIPDSLVRIWITEEYPYDLSAAYDLLNSFKFEAEYLTGYFQSFFANYGMLSKGKSRTPTWNGFTDKNAKEEPGPKGILRIVSKSAYTDSVPKNQLSPKNSGLVFSSAGTSDYNRQTGLLVQDSQWSQTMYITRATTAHRYVPKNDDQVVICGEIRDGISLATLKFSQPEGFVGNNALNIKKELGQEKKFYIENPLKKPVALYSNALNYPGLITNLLLEPGDSIHLEIRKDKTIITGRGSLKNNLYIRTLISLPKLDKALSPLAAKQLIDNWINRQNHIINQYQDSISPWAYDQIRCDLYYSGQFFLEIYLGSTSSATKETYDLLFPSLEWPKYQCISSINMNLFLRTFLWRQEGLFPKSKHPENTEAQSKAKHYYLARTLLGDKAGYVAMAQEINDILRKQDFSSARVLLEDYEKTYKGTDLDKWLRNYLANHVAFENGYPMSGFKLKDLQGRELTPLTFKGKYLLIINVDLNSKEQVDALETYLKIPQQVPGNKLEVLTLFTNKDDSLTQAYMNKRHPSGFFVAAPGFPEGYIEGVNESPADYQSVLLNPDGIIIYHSFGVNFMLERETKMLIEMLNRLQFPQQEATVSRKALYWVLSVSGILVLLAISLVIIIPRRIRKREAANREQLNLKLKAVRSQLNPHFLFNSMNSIQYLVNHNETEKANLFLSKFARLMRKVLKQSETEFVPLKDELETIETYLELESLRHHFRFNIHVDDKIDIFNIEIPVMLLQPFVENAVIHGVSEKGKEGHIEIEARKMSDDRIMIVISDNGKGLQQTVDSRQLSNGKGIWLTRQRIDLMMANYQHDIDFKIENRNKTDNSQTGTAVTITLATEC